jgi:hypothetical protein
MYPTVTIDDCNRNIFHPWANVQNENNETQGPEFPLLIDLRGPLPHKLKSCLFSSHLAHFS